MRCLTLTDETGKIDNKPEQGMPAVEPVALFQRRHADGYVTPDEVRAFLYQVEDAVANLESEGADVAVTIQGAVISLVATPSRF